MDGIGNKSLEREIFKADVPKLFLREKREFLTQKESRKDHSLESQG